MSDPRVQPQQELLNTVHRVRDLAARTGRTARRAIRRARPAERRDTFFTRYESWLPARKRHVVVIADPRSGEDLDSSLTVRRSDELTVIASDEAPEWRLEQRGATYRAATNLAEVNWILRNLGPIDVILNLADGTAQSHDESWRRLFFHLRPRGVYAVRRASITDGGFPESMLKSVTWIGVPPRAQGGRNPAERELAVATARLSVGSDFLVAVKSNRHLLKLRDSDANMVLPQREPRLELTVLKTLPGGTFTSRARVHSHQSDTDVVGLEPAFDYPAHHLRHYRGRIGLVGSALMFTDYSVLPDSFRHHRSGALGHPALTNANGDFARLPGNLRPRRELPGVYFHLDAANSGHFGHLVTEVISRLWGWDLAKRQYPDLKALFRIRYHNERDPILEKRLFNAFGIAESDITWVPEPVWLESVVAATPMWHNQFPHYVHPDIAQIWARLRDNLAVAPSPKGSRIFVSRRQTTTANRACRNITRVEEFFVKRGFDVVYPELHDLGEQAAIFAAAEVVAGFAGSALFNILFSTRLSTLVVLSHEAYTARNEHLFSSIVGADVHYFWSPPDVGHPAEGGWTEAAYYSDWEFDFERNAPDLDALIRCLPR